MPPSPAALLVLVALTFAVSAPAAVPVVKIRGGDGSTRENAVIIEAPNHDVGFNALLDYVGEHYPKVHTSRDMGSRDVDGRQYQVLTVRRAGKKPRLVWIDETLYYGKDPSEEETAEKEKLLKAIETDTRKPTKADLSGAWGSGPNLVGSSWLLAQRGTKVTGRGYNWGCLGVYGSFEITGTYKAGVLRLHFAETTLRQWSETYRCITEKGLPRLKNVNATWTVMRPSIEGREQAAETAKEADGRK